MEEISLKLNSDDQTLAENKVLLLYIISKVGKPISHNELLDLVVSISDMNYFYFQQFLLDLFEDNYIVKYEEDETEIYEITKEGKSALDLTIDMVPGILKLDIDSKFKKNLGDIKNKFSISAESTPINEKEYKIRCKIIDNTDVIFDLNAYAGSKEQAKKIVDNWNNNATEIYPKLLNLLIETEKRDELIDKSNHLDE